MTPEALDALDARCAEAMGLTVIVDVPGKVPVYLIDGQARAFRPTRDPAAFVEAVRWVSAQTDGHPMVARDDNGWVAYIGLGPGHVSSGGYQADPMVAFALALASYGERKGGAA